MVCEEKDYNVLQIDHIYGNGNLDRSLYGGTSNSKFLREVARSYSAGEKFYQLLCANCNVRKARNYKPSAKELAQNRKTESPTSSERLRPLITGRFNYKPSRVTKVPRIPKVRPKREPVLSMNQLCRIAREYKRSQSETASG